jgi:hypothetical protein
MNLSCLFGLHNWQMASDIRHGFVAVEVNGETEKVPGKIYIERCIKPGCTAKRTVVSTPTHTKYYPASLLENHLETYGTNRPLKLGNKSLDEVMSKLREKEAQCCGCGCCSINDECEEEDEEYYEW